MKKSIFLLFALISFVGFTGCDDDEATEVIVDSSLPQGTFTSQLRGDFVAQNNTPTSGTAELGTDEENTPFLRFDSAFNTDLGTGTVSVYFSTSETLVFDPANGNPDAMLVGPISGAGEQFFKLRNSIPAEFTHVILWCGSAGIPFGNAPLN